MRNFFIITLLLGFSQMLISQATESKFKIEIYQNNKLLTPQDGVIHLEKKPFVFKVLLYNINYMEVSASFETFYYDFPSDKNIYECNTDINDEYNCRFTLGKSCAESTFNKSKKLIVGNSDYHLCWFYDPALDWHRFDKKLKVNGNEVIAYKTIHKILDVEIPTDSKTENGYSYPLKEVEKDIYLVFAIKKPSTEEDATPQELQREKLLLKWIK